MLGLPEGHRKKEYSVDDSARVAAYLYLIHKRDGVPMERATEEASRKFHVGKRTVQRYAKGWKGFRDWPIDFLESMAASPERKVRTR